MRSTANSQCNGDRIGMICHRANQMSHHLTRELVPLDAWSITQNGWEPGEKETNMVASFSGVTEGVAILGRVLQYLLHLFSRGGKEFHNDVVLLSSSALILLLHLFDPGQGFCVV